MRFALLQQDCVQQVLHVHHRVVQVVPELLHLERQCVDGAQYLADRGQVRRARSGPT